jgi:hypothetical protein
VTPRMCRHIVLSAAVVDVKSSFVDLRWESSTRFLAVGPAGGYEFEARDDGREAPSLRYRCIISPEEVTSKVRGGARCVPLPLSVILPSVARAPFLSVIHPHVHTRRCPPLHSAVIPHLPAL